MGNIRFTKEQQMVIDTHNRNILVSAAAGSGKTAVLVERIIQMLLDPNRKTTIENLLVVTFTNAAAAEMRERIGEALYRAIELEPHNEKLRTQLTLLPSSTIMTLHAFCLQVIKSHFLTIDLDPSFTIGDDAELTLVRQEIMEGVIEAFYSSNDAAFIEMMDAYAPGKSDQSIEPLLLDLYKLSMSHPTPKTWLDESISRLDIKSEAQWQDSIYAAYLQDEIKKVASSLMAQLHKGIEQVGEEPGLQPYKITFGQYEAILDKILDVESAVALFETIGSIELQRAKSARRGTDKSLSEPVKAILDLIKEGLKKLKSDYGVLDSTDWIEKLGMSHGQMHSMVDVVKAFMEAYQAEKTKRNVIDFNDIEHFALRILEDDAIAASYKNLFDEIMVDEYQDSNLVQETLITRVSRIDRDKPNVFMVGDMKQSIYKFRLAKPELFAAKYDSYTNEDSDYQKIELQKNFRSRSEVIDTTNYIFKQIMSREVGDVVYDKEAALYQGASYTVEKGDYETEFCVIDGQAYPGKNAREVEAHQVARYVQQLVHRDEPIQVFDKQLGEERPLAYGDIAILLRTMSGWSETFVETFRQYNIPIKSMLTTGYFDAIEIQIMLNALSIIDNPKQDIPLLSVMRSPMFGFTADELMTIRLVSRDTDYHTALMTFYNSILGTDALNDKIRHFVETLTAWRSYAKTNALHELVSLILKDTGYYDYCSLMVGGLQRRANLEMFLEQVYKFEQSSYKGLFNFIRYMALVKKQSIDYGIAEIDETGTKQVTLMSIHKSKGLEFPVVIVAGLGKQFNRQDMNKSVLLHQDLGFGTDMIDVKNKVKYASPIKQVIKNQMAVEMLSEEIRILYVALTRAREKLVLFGHVKDIEKQLNKVKYTAGMKAIEIEKWLVKESKSYMDLLFMGLLRHSSLKNLCESYGFEWSTYFELQDTESALKLNVIKDSYEGLEKSLLESEDSISVDEALLKRLETAFEWIYPFSDAVKHHVSQSVSELKKKDTSEDSVYIGPSTQTTTQEPAFMIESAPMSGAAKGTVYHKVMEQLDLSAVECVADIDEQLSVMIEKRVITEKEASTVQKSAIVTFVSSQVGKRALIAQREGVLNKEKPFIMGIYNEDAMDYQMIQGVIDMYFEEDGALIMIDYKTDYMKGLEETVLVDRYKTQMKLYKQALEMQSGKVVKEIYLYSVGLQRHIKVDMINFS